MMYRLLQILLVLLVTRPFLVAQTVQLQKENTTEMRLVADGCESVQSGDWHNPSTWSCNRLPTIDDLVTINAGHTVTISANDAQANRIVYNGGTIQFTGVALNLFIKNGSPLVATSVIYRIRAGRQYCDQSALVFTPKTTLSFSATFDNSAIYTSQLPENQNDINKLYGFSDCDMQHNIASARFGWNWRDNALRIYAYCYTNGQRISQELGTVLLNMAYNYQLSIVEGNYVFTFNGQQTVIARGCNTVESTKRYLLYPYFGGDEVAPHDITISITDK